MKEESYVSVDLVARSNQTDVEMGSGNGGVYAKGLGCRHQAGVEAAGAHLGDRCGSLGTELTTTDQGDRAWGTGDTGEPPDRRGYGRPRGRGAGSAKDSPPAALRLAGSGLQADAEPARHRGVTVPVGGRAVIGGRPHRSLYSRCEPGCPKGPESPGGYQPRTGGTVGPRSRVSYLRPAHRPRDLLHQAARDSES